jgi:DnaK suppressor protein
VKADTKKTKSAAKAPAAPAKKAAPVAKAPAKAVSKPVAKAATPKAAPAAKGPSKAKPVAAPAPKPAKPVTKAVAKAPVKPAAKTAEKPAAKASAKTATPAPVAAPAPVQTQPRFESVPPRAIRPSSRLAQLTVPSMAQSVASTAAKASYLQTMPTTAQVQPPMAAPKKDPKLANNWKTKSAAELTDAEVMAMADSEYMNEKQLAFFRLKLVQLKQDIHNSAGETTEHLREDTVVVPDPADRATIEEEHALELRTRDRERKLLKKIEQSIARIDAGDYGYCDETGEPIGVGRLIARPTATLSLEAQQRRELKQKMFGD